MAWTSCLDMASKFRPKRDNVNQKCHYPKDQFSRTRISAILTAAEPCGL